ncbi:uncharacterized protein LOC143883539 [Tasmannia lanceolata]|uniref:uncharacterized protein LOC143883539 n=1 Tax=Tasmannia lanceolata TaxID=3420 RepID=UPI0040628CA4
MKGMKGKILKKLKSIGQVSTLKIGLVLQVNDSSDGLLDPFPQNSGKVFQNPSFDNLTPRKPDIIDISELMRDPEEDEEMGFSSCSSDKENIRPPPSMTKVPIPMKENSEIETSNTQNIPIPMKENSGIETPNTQNIPLSELDVTCFRPPKLNSGSLFDPNLLAAFEQAVKNHYTIQKHVERGRYDEETENHQKDEEPHENPLLEFEERCPPGGIESVVLYTTSIRGIRKTFEDCRSITFLLKSLKVVYSERDVSMHLEFREELWKIMGGRVVPPRLFIKGRYIGGADEVLGLHEQGKLRRLVEGIPLDKSGGACDGCGGVCFLPCFDCNGSRKLVPHEQESPSIRCPKCNENGLILCSLCC